ncbi:MAG: GNAT family N-acetyltransferase [Oscillospiraceae bacterium]
MIRFATEVDIPGLKTLWTMSFDDPINYIDFFYDKLARPCDTLIFDEDGQIAAMLTLIPTALVYRDKSVRAAYVYGAATHKNYRSRGVMTALLAHAEEYARTQGYSLVVLVPGEKYLFDYYKRRGYSADFNCRVAEIKHGMLRRDIVPDTETQTDALSIDELYELREAALADIAHIAWKPDALRGILLDAKIYDEHIESYEGKYGRAFAIYGQHKRRLYIKECLGSSVEAQHCLLRMLLEKIDPRMVTVQLPLHSELFMFESQTRLFGMAKLLSGNTNIKDMDAYMNLMLD